MASNFKLRNRRQAAARDRRLWQQYVDGGRVDDDLRNLLVAEVLPVAQRLARQVHFALCRLLPLEDLEQEAAIGLIDSARKFDPQRGVSFRAFSYRRMMGRMLDAARDRDDLTRHHRRLVKQREAYEEAHRQRHGNRPASHVVCEALGWSERRYMETLVKSDRSLDEAVYDNDNSATLWRDLVAGAAEDPSSAIEVEHLARRVLDGLGLRDQFLVWSYLFHEKTMREIGSFLGVCESRISQRFTELKPKLLRRLADGD